uniref:Uncharacterized protein n=1 Tax=Triticum urartu TaxID=4572 RepID=A0A8R7QWD8_TRIUA
MDRWNQKSSEPDSIQFFLLGAASSCVTKCSFPFKVIKYPPAFMLVLALL